MNRITVSIVLAVSSLLLACGNKGELFLETDTAITEEIKQLDDSLDEIEADSDTKSGTDSVTEEAKKAKKKADGTLPDE